MTTTKDIIWEWTQKIIGVLIAMVLGLAAYTFTALASDVQDIKEKGDPVAIVQIKAVDTRLTEHIAVEDTRHQEELTQLEKLNVKMDAVIQELAAQRGRPITTAK